MSHYDVQQHEEDLTWKSVLYGFSHQEKNHWTSVQIKGLWDKAAALAPTEDLLDPFHATARPRSGEKKVAPFQLSCENTACDPVAGSKPASRGSDVRTGPQVSGGVDHRSLSG